MRTVSYDSVLRAGLEMAGQTFPPQAQDGVTWRGWIEKELRTAWEADPWPDLMRVEQRYLRPLYAAGTTYAAGAEVYYPVERKYYVALRATTGNLPTALAYWAESKVNYNAADWAVDIAYAVGAQTRYTVNDAYYACHTAGTGNLPTNTGFFGPLVPFIPDILYEQPVQNRLGDVVGVWNKNPRVFSTAQRLPFRLTERGVSLYAISTTVWLEYRIRPLRFFGDTFDALVTYAADDQVYLSPDFYTCLATTAAGESPVTTPAKWSVVAFPEIFSGYVAHAAYVRWLRSDGQNDKAAQESVSAAQELMRQGINVSRTQRQTRPLEVLTR